MTVAATSRRSSIHRCFSPFTTDEINLSPILHDRSLYSRNRGFRCTPAGGWGEPGSGCAQDAAIPNDDVIGDTLAGFQIGYEHVASLGGLRGRQLPRETSPNTLWKNRSFRNYADYALSADFHKGLNRLVALGRERRTVFMCAEAVWWRCHRRIITDYLLAAGEQVFHIFDVDNVVGAEMTPGAQPDSQGRVVYPGS